MSTNKTERVKAALLKCAAKSEELEDAAKQLTVQKLRSQLCLESKLKKLDDQLKVAGQHLLSELVRHHDQGQAKIHQQQLTVLKHNMALSSAMAKEEMVDEELCRKVEEFMAPALTVPHFVPSSKFDYVASCDIGFFQLGQYEFAPAPCDVKDSDQSESEKRMKMKDFQTERDAFRSEKEGLKTELESVKKEFESLSKKYQDLVEKDENMSMKYQDLVEKEDKVSRKYDDLVSKLQEGLKCPVCLSVPMAGPISVCPNGHLACPQCKARIRTCPTCRAQMQVGRSLLAETVIENIEHKCKHGRCEVVLDLKVHGAHVKKCLHRVVMCPSPLCGEEMPLSSLYNHLSRECRGSVNINDVFPVDICWPTDCNLQTAESNNIAVQDR